LDSNAPATALSEVVAAPESEEIRTLKRTIEALTAQISEKEAEKATLSNKVFLMKKTQEINELQKQKGAAEASLLRLKSAAP
jgi:molybdopterin converting factor small subunit